MEPIDPIHYAAPQDDLWTTTNIGEGIPGVQTPLSWTLWRPVGVAVREVGFAVGALSRSERAVEDGVMEIFYGRAAFRIAPFARLGDRLPGTSGEDVVAGLLGRVPEGLALRPTVRRYPIVAWRFPMTFIRTPRRLRALQPEMDAWYARRLRQLPALDRDPTVALIVEARQRLIEMVTLQTITALSVVQPLHETLEKLVARTGVGDAGTLGGGGGAELAGLVGDLWRASRGHLSVAEVAGRHGFHGPLEGELSSRVWREDPTPLERIVAEYAARPDREDPVARLRERSRAAEAMSERLLAALPAWQRPATRTLLRMAAGNIPLRGVAKVFLLQAFDVGRAAARRLGELLTAEDVLDAPDDVFFLTFDELTGALPADARELIEWRRARREEYLGLAIPSDWRGRPVPEAGVDIEEARVVEGVGVSAGVYEGRARVVLSPEFDEVEPDEVLIAPTTDPSWASIMFISGALVVDIGGALSHAAVVARELGIPCVVNTRTGTRQIRTGDRVRVDGNAGTVEVLARATPTTASTRRAP
jgi:rifampicin phosphotransferase